MDNIKTFLIFGLLIVSLLLWEAWQNEYARPAQVAEQTMTEAGVYPVEEKGDLPDLPVISNVSDGSLPALEKRRATGGSKQVHIKTDLMDLYIDSKGGDIRRLALSKYPVESSEPDVPVQFINDNAAEAA